MNISILLPTRNNVDGLLTAIESYIENFSGTNKLEILVAVDDDDETRFLAIEKLKKYSEVKFYTFPFRGYYRLHEYINDLAAVSSGHIISLSSDKSTMKTKNWDLFLQPYENKFIVTGPTVEWISLEGVKWTRNELLFPIISRMWYDVLGFICDQPHLDSFIITTVEYLNGGTEQEHEIYKKVKFILNDVIIEMDRRKDPGIYKPGESSFDSQAAKQIRFYCFRKISKFLIENPSFIP